MPPFIVGPSTYQAIRMRRRAAIACAISKDDARLLALFETSEHVETRVA
jgi:hypothetical protein